MSHTAGPWRLDGVEIYGANGKHVVWELGNENPDDHALILAVTDLLDALKALYHAMPDSDGDYVTDTRGNQILKCVGIGAAAKAARDAIAKAEGR